MRAELAVAARPELVRTARLTAGQAARRAGVADDVVDDVRLAVGTAVARAVVRAGDPKARVRLELLDGADRFIVRVHDPSDPTTPDDDEGLALALVGSLTEGLEQTPHPEGGTLLSLWWPLADEVAARG